MNNDAVAKITMLKSSTRCFFFGLLGLLPGIGLPFAILALWNGGKARVREKIYWNAARPFRIWGVIAASVGLIFWTLTAAVIAFDAFSNRF